MLIFSLFLLLSSNAVSMKRDKSVLFARSLIAILVISVILGLNATFMVFLFKGLGLFHGLFHDNAITHIFHIFIFFICIFTVLLNSFYPRKVWITQISNLVKQIENNTNNLNFFINKMAEQFRIIEYPLLLLFVTIGGSFLMCCSDLISIFLAIELQSYGLYLLCCVYRDSEKATSAGLTYFLLGGLSSCFILLASGILYINSGNTNFDGIYIINNISDQGANTVKKIKSTFMFLYESYYIHFCFIVMSVGFLFKVTAAPFHFWSPDVYDSIPTIVTTFVAIFAKISIFILLLELVYFTSNYFTVQEKIITDINMENNALYSNYNWTSTFLVSSLLSLIIGSILGLTQSRIKKLYAYSTISHIGFILLALSINSVESIQSFLFYLIQYSLSNLNAFILLITIGYSLYFYMDNKNDIYSIEKKKDEFNDWEYKTLDDTNVSQNNLLDKKNSPLQLISEIKGYFYVNPILALSLALTIFSFVGIPPLVGFFAKQMILSSALNNGYVFMALVAILTSVISACYYLGLINQMFFEKPDYIYNPQLLNVAIKCNLVDRFNNYLQHIKVNFDDIKLSSSLTVVISILTLIVSLFILSPQEFLTMTSVLSLILFDSL